VPRFAQIFPLPNATRFPHDTLMRARQNNRFILLVENAQSRLRAQGGCLGGVNEKTIRDWANRAHSPGHSSGQRIGEAIWKQIHQPGWERVREALLDYIPTIVPEAPRRWDKESFILFFCQLAEDEHRLDRLAEKGVEDRPQLAWATTTSRTPGGQIPCATGEKAKLIQQHIDALFSDADFSVFDGVVSFGAKTKVHLQPLYAYLERLQLSPEIPHQFRPGQTIKLDQLYVELTVAEDQRASRAGDGARNRGTGVQADSPAPDPVTQWHVTAPRHRIPLAALLSRTEVRPAVLFGDPGAGKSTLTNYALHLLAQNLAKAEGPGAGAVIPFRLVLREFALQGKADHFKIVPYLLRRVLKVPAECFEDWLTLMSHFFRKERPVRLLLLVDGVDEITPNAELFPVIQQGLEEVAGISRLIITSRRAGFEPPVRTYESFELIDLSEFAMHGLIENWFRTVHQRTPEFILSFRRWVFADPRRQEMAANPCLLSLLCFLNQDCPEEQFLQAANRTELYRLAVEKLSLDYERLGSAHLGDALDSLANFALDRYLNLGESQTPHVLFSREEVRQFSHRRSTSETLPRRADPGRRPEFELDTTWLRTRLVSRWDLGQWFHFVHLSFQEYFAACWLVTLPREEVQSLLDRHRFNPYWREVWRFYAGLCRGTGAAGADRFKELASAYVHPRDLFGQCLLWLAPVCAEYGLRDTRDWLGFDLRTELYGLFIEGHHHTRAHIRRMVDIDPEYFLDVARQVLDRQLVVYSHSAVRTRKPDLPSGGDVQVAVELLECIYHPAALQYQKSLIETEVHWPKLNEQQPPLGPTAPSGRNEPLSAALARWLETVPGRFQRERLVTYLACVRGHEAAAAILQAGRKERTLASKAGPAGGKGVLEFQVHCLSALCEMQDPRALELAAELWSQPEFRRQQVAEACTCLSQVKHPDVPALMERWLDDEGVKLDALAFDAILDILKEWPERPIPESLEVLLLDSRADPTVRATGWEVVVRCGGSEGRQSLRRHMLQLGAKAQLSENQAVEIMAIAAFIGEQRLPLVGELEALKAKSAVAKNPAVVEALWSSLTQLHSLNSRLPSHRQWLCEQSLPALQLALLRVPDDPENDTTGWLHAFRGCQPDVLQALTEMVLEVWPSLAKKARVSLLRFFTELPAYAPPSILPAAAASDDSDFWDPAIQILAEINPGALMRRPKSDPRITKALFQKSVRDGTLFFHDTFYSPLKLTFQTYTKPHPRSYVAKGRRNAPR
jgi:hypothetical protein